MSPFEFVFVLYSLVLGLSLVELLNGLGRTLEYKLSRSENHRAFSIGALTPLLATFMLLDLLSFWIFAWTVREYVAANRLTILGAMVFSSAYFLASRLVFPGDPENFTALNTHYLRVRRIVFAMLLVMTGVQWLFLLSVPELAERLISPVNIGMTGLLIALMGAAMVVRSERANTALLAVLIGRYLLTYLL